MNIPDHTTIAIYFWKPVCGNRHPIYVSSPNLYESLKTKAVRSLIVDYDEFALWCSTQGIAFENEGDFGSIPMADDNARLAFKMRWW